MTQDDIAEYMELIKSVDYAYIADSSMRQAKSEVSAYYSGEIELDEAIEVAQQTMEILISE